MIGAILRKFSTSSNLSIIPSFKLIHLLREERSLIKLKAIEDRATNIMVNPYDNKGKFIGFSSKNIVNILVAFGQKKGFCVSQKFLDNWCFCASNKMIYFNHVDLSNIINANLG